MLLSTFAMAGGKNDKINVLVITGGHGFEEEPFFTLFRENAAITFTSAIQDTTAIAYEHPDLYQFQVIVLYDMIQNITAVQKENFLSLFDKGIGLVVLHHALVSFQKWPEYERIIGGKYLLEGPEKSDYQHDVQMPITVVAKDHPITAGLQDFIIHDEIYIGFRVHPQVTPLLRTTHPGSGNPIAWCRDEGKSRVVSLQLGHDHMTYQNPNYRQLLAQCIKWAAGGK